MAIQTVRGFKDLLPQEAAKFQFIERTAREVFHAFGFGELCIPVLEKTELFKRSIGETTDIVEKEMYTFTDRSGDSLTMRPEATAGVNRAYVEHKLHGQPGPHKLFTIGPMFRHERPQKGRLRQFHQLNAEVLGDDGPQTDAELMVMLTQILDRLGLENIELAVNSLGCPACRPAYRQALIDFFADKKDQLCEDCLRRLDKNPLRILDCKSEGCKAAGVGAPTIDQFWCPDCVTHFQAVQDYLGLAGVSFRLDTGLVRGLDYYVRTTFEALAGDLGAQNAVAGGGRYDGLIELLGGPAQGAMGWASGIERLMLLLPDRPEFSAGPRLFMAALGTEPRRWAFATAQKLRAAGVSVEMTPDDRSLKAQLRRADKLGAALVLIVGPEEYAAGRGQLKDMSPDGGQEEIALEDLVPRLRG